MLHLLKRIWRKCSPAKGLKYGYLNHTKVEAGAVVKSFVGADRQRRYKNELTAIEYFRGKFPVAELVAKDEETLTLRTKLIAGIHAADVEDDRAQANVQHACGRVLKGIHQTPIADLSSQITGAGSAVLHGDFTVRNLLVSEQNHQVVAILDWEKMRLGEPLSELYWYEWTYRLSCEVERRHLMSFYAGYGMDFPQWEIRKSGMLERLQCAIDDAVERDDLPGVTYWNEQYQIGNAFEELT